MHYDLISVHERIVSSDFPPKLRTVEKMVLILEDRRFFSHYGIDILSVLREMLRWALRFRHGGASTIDMQFVRTATGFRERTIRRKLYEMLLAAIIQLRYSKMKILRSYLDCAYFGTRIDGIEKASLSVFEKWLDDLELDECAEIAAMLVYPRPSRLTDRWRLKLERRKRYAQRLYVRYEKRFD